MQIDKIQGHIMNDMESQMFLMCGESDRAFQKVVDVLNEIGCTSFILSKEEIKEVIK